MENERLLTPVKLHAEMEWARTQLKDIAAQALSAGEFTTVMKTIYDYTSTFTTKCALLDAMRKE